MPKLIQHRSEVTKEPIPQQILNDWFAPAPAPIIPDVPTVQLRMTKAGNKRNRAGEWILSHSLISSLRQLQESISVSSDSSEVSQDVSDYAPKDITTVGDDEETDTDDVKIIDKRPKKRTRGMSPLHLCKNSIDRCCQFYLHKLRVPLSLSLSRAPPKMIIRTLTTWPSS